MLLTDVCPVGYLQSSRVDIVEQHLTGVVVPIAYQVTAKRTLALSALGLYQIDLLFLEGYILLPHITVLLFTGSKDLRNDIFELYRIHNQYYSC